MSDQPLIGKSAPKFRAVDVLGNRVRLSDYDDGYVLLVFLRYSGCPWCNLAIHRLTLEYKQLGQLHCSVVAFVQSDTEGVMTNIYGRHRRKPPYPIIADKQMKHYKQYNVDSSVIGSVRAITKIPHWLESVRKYGYKQTKLDGQFFMVPAWFLVNARTGKVVRSERGVSFYDHETFISIYDSLTFKD